MGTWLHVNITFSFYFQVKQQVAFKIGDDYYVFITSVIPVAVKLLLIFLCTSIKYLLFGRK